MDPVTALAALVPLVVETGKALINRFIATENFKPATIEQWATIQDKQIALFQAINAVGSTAESYRWVEAIIKLQRPFVVVCVLGLWAYTRAAGQPSEAVDNAASVVSFYLFGDRTLFYSRQAIGAAVRK